MRIGTSKEQEEAWLDWWQKGEQPTENPRFDIKASALRQAQDAVWWLAKVSFNAGWAMRGDHEQARAEANGYPRRDDFPQPEEAELAEMKADYERRNEEQWTAARLRGV